MYSPPAPVSLWCYCWSPCGQPGSVTHSTDGDNSSHPTHHPALTLTLGVGITTALTPEMFDPSSSSLRQDQISEPEGNLPFPPGQAAAVGCCLMGPGAASQCALAQGGRGLARCPGDLTHTGPGWAPHGSRTRPPAAPGPFVRAGSLTSLGTPWGCV